MLLHLAASSLVGS